MNFLNKIEDLINTLLVRFQELFFLFVQKITPAKVKLLVEKTQTKKNRFKEWLKTLPLIIKNWIVKKIAVAKEVTKFDLKGKLKESYEAALARTKTNDAEVKGKLHSIKKIFMADRKSVV